MRLRLSRKAQADLDEVRDYGVEWFGAARAIRYLDAIEQAFRRIQAYPALGTSRDEARPGLRVIACERHRIYYQDEGETIMIVRVLHEAMDATRHLHGRP